MEKEKDSNIDLEHDSQDWTPEEENSGQVAFVEQPFAMSTTSEIREAQESDDALELDDDFESEENADEQLESIAQAIQEEDARYEDEMSELAAGAEEDPEEELARQIAEDQAVEEELARQAEEEEEVDEELQAALPQVDEDGQLDLIELQSCIETLLFMSQKPVSIKRLREYLGPDFSKELFEEATQAMQARFAEACHGVELVEVAGGLQLRTKPGRAALAKKLAKVQTQRLSTGAMETLAIVAYEQPVMKEDVDKIRGVDTSYFIRGLLNKNLIKISGRSELPGRPMLYSTTTEFLEVFGLKNLESLPALRELEQMIPKSENDEDPKIKEMRRIVQEMNADRASIKYDPREDEVILSDLKTRIKDIDSSSPYLEHQKVLDRMEREAEEQGLEFDRDAAQAELQKEAMAARSESESELTDSVDLGEGQEDAPVGASVSPDLIPAELAESDSSVEMAEVDEDSSEETEAPEPSIES